MRKAIGIACTFEQVIAGIRIYTSSAHYCGIIICNCTDDEQRGLGRYGCAGFVSGFAGDAVTILSLCYGITLQTFGHLISLFFVVESSVAAGSRRYGQRIYLLIELDFIITWC